MVNGPRVLGVVLLICGLLILFFKADWLIAGYNTMTEAEKAEGFGSDPPSGRLGGIGLTGFGLMLLILSFFIQLLIHL